jgi:hypothetical protein
MARQCKIWHAGEGCDMRQDTANQPTHTHVAHREPTQYPLPHRDTCITCTTHSKHVHHMPPNTHTCDVSCQLVLVQLQVSHIHLEDGRLEQLGRLGGGRQGACIDACCHHHSMTVSVPLSTQQSAHPPQWPSCLIRHSSLLLEQSSFSVSVQVMRKKNTIQSLFAPHLCDVV